MQEVISKHGLLNIEKLNSSHPGSLILFAEVLRQNTSQKFLPAYQIRRVFTSACNTEKLLSSELYSVCRTFKMHSAYLKIQSTKKILFPKTLCSCHEL